MDKAWNNLMRRNTGRAYTGILLLQYRSYWLLSVVSRTCREGEVEGRHRGGSVASTIHMYNPIADLFIKYTRQET